MSADLASAASGPIDEATRRAFDAVPQILWAMHARGRVAFLNRAGRAFWGAGDAAPAPSDFTEFIHPDDREAARRAWDAARAHLISFDRRVRLVAPMGQARWFVLQAQSWFAAPAAPAHDGEPTYWIVTATDVHELHEAAADSTRGERRFRALRSAVSDLTWSAAGDGAGDGQTFAQGERLLGEATGRFTTPQWQARVHPEDVDRLTQAWTSAVESGRPFECEYRFQDASGEWREVVGRGAPVVGADDRTEEWVGTVVDVTSQKESRGLLKERDFLEAVLENVDEAIISCDLAGRITFRNRSARELEGGAIPEVPPEQWIEQAHLYLPDGQTRMPLAELPLSRALRGEVVRNVEVVVAPPGRPSRVTVVSGRAVFNARGEQLGAVVVVHDVTEQRRLERQLQQAQKMEAIGRLAGGVAHDFNNLLTVINGYSDMLLESLPETHLGRDPAAAIREASERAAELTTQLLAFSRQSVIAPRVVDLNHSIGALEKMLQRLVGEAVVLTLALGRDVGAVKIDPTHLTQVLMNLAVNARDAMPRGGQLTIETHPCELSVGDSLIAAGLAAGQYALIAVTDTGHGIPPELRHRIFEPFFTTKDPGRGTGLGLATVYGIVKQVGGHLDVYSEVGHGATFKVFLPTVDVDLSDGSAATDGHAEAAGALTYHGHETILFVEDDAGVRQLTRRALERIGYRVLDAEDGADALALVERRNLKIDLLVTDVVMPHIDGRQLAETLSQRHPAMRVLYVSGYPDEAAVLHEVIAAGAPLLRKPFSTVTLGRKVREILDARPGSRR